MKAQRVILSALILCLVVAVIPARAGGPLLIGNATLGMEGEPLVWDNTVPVSYRTDGGSLGSLTTEQANERVRLAFEAWRCALLWPRPCCWPLRDVAGAVAAAAGRNLLRNRSHYGSSPRPFPRGPRDRAIRRHSKRPAEVEATAGVCQREHCPPVLH